MGDGIDVILQAFDRSAPDFSDFTDRIRSLVVDLLNVEQIAVHSVTGRTKDRASLEGKLSRPGKRYHSLADVTDLSGVRITTYFADDVQQVADLILREFEIDEENSVDKSMALGHDRFGYLSLHFVVSLPPSRRGLAENRRFPEMKCEVQVRSILQHAWAEIEHDLGYKTERGLPREARRRFSRLAGLLELADQEFCGIRRQLRDYEAEVSERIEENAADVGVDGASVAAFISSEPLALQLDREIATGLSAQLSEEVLQFVTEIYAGWLEDLGISNLADLKRVLEANLTQTVQFAITWLGRGGRTVEHITLGVGIGYLCLRLAALRGDPDFLVRLFQTGKLGGHGDLKAFAEEMIAMANAL